MRKAAKHMKKADKVKNIISVILPIVSIFAIALGLRMEPTGLVVYKEDIVYSINGSISISLQDKMPADSYIEVSIGDYAVKIRLEEFLEKSGKEYGISDGFVIGNGVYKVGFVDLGIVQGFEKGNYKIITEVVHENLVLYSDEEVIDI